MECKFCKRILKQKSSLVIHERSCKHNPNRIKGHWEKESYKQKHRDLAAKRPSPSKETRDKISAKLKIHNNTAEYKEKQSKRMRRAVLENPDSYSDKNVVGRSKHVTVNGIRFNSSWEVLVAELLDKEKIVWERKGLQPLPYIWKEKEHLYFPDFYLTDYDMYIEVKGYETARDRAKWNHCTKKILIIKQKEIDLINQNTYSILEQINGESSSQVAVFLC